ncbi:hypothetical protein N2152v2_007184 [Parachlorella kessleri]
MNIEWRPSLEMLKEEGWDVRDTATPDSSSSSQSSSNGSRQHDSADPGYLENVGIEPLQPTTARPHDDSSDGGGNGGKSPRAGSIVVLENGIKFVASPMGQKTGFYADQRDSRATLRVLAAGRSVLDLCCYSGGFALGGAVGGATQVLGVDSSAAALELAQQNAELNDVAGSCRFVKADVGDFMKQAVAEGQQWDIVVFDPPKLAPNRKSLARALQRYRRLNAQAMRLAAARDAGKRIVVLREAGPALDHTLDPAYPEGRYLTNVLLRVS